MKEKTRESKTKSAKEIWHAEVCLTDVTTVGTLVSLHELELKAETSHFFVL